MFQSTELTGGTGFTFEDAAVAVYLAALLGEETAPGLPGRVVVRVASQQAAFGHPLDDLVVEGRSSDDVPARLSLQVKRSIVVSAAASNADFREVVSWACETVKDDGFREGTVKLSPKGTGERRSSLELRTYAAALAPVISAQIANACARTAR